MTLITVDNKPQPSYNLMYVIKGEQKTTQVLLDLKIFDSTNLHSNFDYMNALAACGWTFPRLLSSYAFCSGVLALIAYVCACLDVRWSVR